jgi:hypothetical protein
MKTRFAFAVAIVSLSLARTGAAQAQYYGYSSTAAEGFLHGSADLTRAVGEFNLSTSQAAINGQEAYRRAIGNQRDAVETRWDLKQEYEYRRAERRPRSASSEETARWNRDRLPKRLSDSQFDPATGTIRWYGVLRDDEYAEGRAELQRLFAERRSGENGAGTPNCRQIGRAVNTMKRQLQRDVKTLSADEYIPAKKFLDSLAYEARFASNATTQSLAAK